MVRRLLLASTSSAKLRDLAALCRDLPYQVLSPGDLPHPLPEVEEDGATFEANALKKARSAAAAVRAAGRRDVWCLADDSGLQVDALHGAPGVHSARFAGVADGGRDAANNALLLARLEGIAPAARTARFVCVLSLVAPDGDERLARGSVDGTIALQPAGEMGFGYDPLFHHEASGCTFGQLSREVKGRISHRGRAMSELRRVLADLAGEKKG